MPLILYLEKIAGESREGVRMYNKLTGGKNGIAH